MARVTERVPSLDDPDERLRWARKRTGFDDATAAARRFGWNENTYRSHENAQRGISKKAAEQYAKVFKVSVAWLLYGEGAMAQPVDPEMVNLWDNLTEEGRETIKQLMRQMPRRVA